MPANLPRDQKNFPELFGADGHWQNPAMIDALMNYSAIYERLGTVVYNPPGAATDPAAAPADAAAAPATDPAAAPATDPAAAPAADAAATPPAPTGNAL